MAHHTPRPEGHTTGQATGRPKSGREFTPRLSDFHKYAVWRPHARERPGARTQRALRRKWRPGQSPSRLSERRRTNVSCACRARCARQH
eukprot:2950643-Prymnesium_polylepis.1